MIIILDELINGWVLTLSNKQPEFFETKREALAKIESFVNQEQIHELNLLIEGSKKAL